MIEQEFVYNELESLGFFEWLSETHNLKDTDMKPEYLDKLPLDDIHRTVCNSMAFRWFREKYGLNHEIPYAGKVGKHHAFVKNYIYGNNGNYPSVFTYEEAELACLKKLIEIANEEPTNSKGIS